jgi:hypothetical protein
MAGLAGSVLPEPAAAATPNLVRNPSFERRHGTDPW